MRPGAFHHVACPRTVGETHLDDRGVEPALLVLDAGDRILPAHPAEHDGDIVVGEEHRFDPRGGIRSRFDRRAARQLQPDGERSLIDVGEYVALEGERQQDAGGERHHCDADDPSAPFEGALQRAMVPLREHAEDPIEPVQDRPEQSTEQPADGARDASKRPPDERRRYRFGITAPPRRHGGEQGDRHRETHYQGEGDGEGQRAKKLAGHPLDVDDRPEDADRREGRRGDRPLDLLGATRRGFEDIHSFLTMPEDVLEHDDRIVDEHSDAQSETAQAHDVERHVREIQERERPHHRNRNGERDRDRIACVTQE